MFKKILAAGLVAPLSFFGVQSALACSGYSPRSYQYRADVVVAGKVAAASDGKSESVVARRVLKGERHRAYRIVWQGVSSEDECAFLSPIPRDRGVFFLQRREDGAYYVLWTEDRWKMVR